MLILILVETVMYFHDRKDLCLRKGKFMAIGTTVRRDIHNANDPPWYPWGGSSTPRFLMKAVTPSTDEPCGPVYSL